MLTRTIKAGLLCLALLFVLSQRTEAWTRGFVIPTAAVVCTITTGNCTGTGGGSSLFTAATCNGVADVSAAFTSFNTWAVGTWQSTHTGLIELDIPSGKDCRFLSGGVATNSFGAGIKQFQIVGYGATLSSSGVAVGFFLGGGASAGVQFNGTTSTVLVATVASGASSLTVLDTAKCGLWSAGDWAAITGIDPQGFGDPPNPQVYEWIQIASTASCAGSGIITLSAPLSYSYKSTWPAYFQGNAFQSNDGGPATLYAVNQIWNTTQAYYGLTISQPDIGTNYNANGKDITFRDVNMINGSCGIPSQNLNFRFSNVSASTCSIEVDKIVSNIAIQSSNIGLLKFQSGGPLAFSCAGCTLATLSGTAGGSNSIASSSIASLLLGPTSYGAGGSLAVSNTAITSLGGISGSGTDGVGSIGIWASGTLTVPQNISVTSASSCGASCTDFLVNTTAGWSSGLTIGISAGSGCSAYAGQWTVTVVSGTHITIPTTFGATCVAGTIGNLPLTWAVPRANVYFSGGSRGISTGPVLQVADLAVGANNSTVVSFNQNGSAYAGGLPTMPGGPPFAIKTHPAPLWSCTNCTGDRLILDVNNVASGPFGSTATRVITAANSGVSPFMSAWGTLSEVDMTVTAACSGASNIGFQQPQFIQTLGSTSTTTWDPTANAAIASATPRIVTPTTSSGAQSLDSLVTPGAGTLMLFQQSLPAYSNVANCASASTTVTMKTNQGVVYP